MVLLLAMLDTSRLMLPVPAKLALNINSKLPSSPGARVPAGPSLLIPNNCIELAVNWLSCGNLNKALPDTVSSGAATSVSPVFL